MYFLKPLCRGWLPLALFIFVVSSCEIDSQLSELAAESEYNESNNADQSLDSARFRLGNVIYEESMEGSSPFSQFVSRQLPGSHSFQVATSPILEGQKSGRFELRKGDKVVTNSGIRTEMSFRPELLDQLKLEGWYSFAVYLPSEGFTPDDDDETLTQWHTSGSPYLSLRVTNDRFQFRIGTEYIDLGRVVKDAWYQYVFHIKHATGSGGLVEVWQNGEKVISKTGKSADSATQPNWKIGIYKPTWEKSNTSTSKRIVYYDNVKIGSRNASYEEMLPSKSKLNDPKNSLPTGPVDLNKGLVAHWKMDEGRGNILVDHSGKSNNATIVDPTGIKWVTGKVGSAVRMPDSKGRYFSEVRHNSSLNLTDAVTISAWIRPSVGGTRTIISKIPNGYELGTFENGTIEFRINRESDGATYRLRSNKRYPTDGKTWMHVVATFDGSSSVIYVNGVSDNSAGYGPTKIRANSNPLTIGARGTIYRWEGDLDDVRVYNRAVSRSEAASLFSGDLSGTVNKPSATPPSTSPSSPSPAPTGSPAPSIPQDVSKGLVGFWKMDEGSGRTLMDHSGNKNNASIVDESGVRWVKGRDGSAIRMDNPSGRYYSTVPHNSTLNMTNAITISAWIRPGVTANRAIVSKAPNGFELGTFENGKIEFRINRESDGSKYRLRSKTSYPTDQNTWIHVAATFDGTNSTIYINGVADNSANYPNIKIRQNNNPLVIGARNSGYRWEGDIDNLMIYNRALSATEIKGLAR